MSASSEVRFRVGDMDCPSCVAKIERHLTSIDGVEAVQASVVARTLRVWHGDELSSGRIQDEVGRLGYNAHPFSDDGPGKDEPSQWKERKALITYAAMALFALGIAATLANGAVLADVLFVSAAVVGGSNFFAKGLRSALRLDLDMNFLMTIAIVGAVALGETMEAAAIAFLFSIAELLESFAVDRARASVAALVRMAPDSARRVRDGQEVVVPAAALETGDVVLVRPGERIPIDGHVIEGLSGVDQSPITGESIPVDRAPGDDVFAGSINGDGVLRIEVDRLASESTLARIARMIEDAEAGRAPSERFVERFARYYTPAVTIAAVLVALVPPLLAGAAFEPWILRGLTLLVIACPCALVISTPVAVVSGLTAAARHGVLIKGGVYLEAIGRARAVAFDKTGTLTVGHPRVVGLHPAQGVEIDALLAAAAGAERDSAHPIARAVIDAADERGLAPAGAVTDARTLPGLGAVAMVDGRETVVGRSEALRSHGIEVPEVGAAPEPEHTLVGVASAGCFLGWIAMADEPRRDSERTVATLRRMGVEHVVMLTGDAPETARAIGRRTGIDDVYAGLMPEEKVTAVRELVETWGAVVMIGDGVNDGPALAAATVGVAMGSAGSDVALETADVALMGDEIGRLPYLMRLSTRAGRVIRQNIAIAIAVKLVLAIGVPLGMVSLVAAVVIGDMGVSLAVILNALRLGRIVEA